MAKKVTEQESNDLFNLSEETAAWTEQKSKTDDGLYRPSLDKAKGSKDYKATLRFLPNLRRDGTVGPSAIEKHLHYADFKTHADVAGYYDCMKQFEGEKCDLCNMYWALDKSKNSANNEKKKLISRSTKYYAYVLVLEDKNQPDLEGKILIYPFGYKIAQKIKAQKEHAKNPCRVEDLSNGKDFNLVITEFGGYANYDQCDFDERGPITIGGMPAPIDPATGKIKASAQEKVKQFLLSRTVDIENYLPVRWTEDQVKNVNKILALLSGDDLGAPAATPGSTMNASDVFNTANTAANTTTMDAASFFDADDNEPEEDSKESSKSKVSQFFDDID